MDEVYLIWMLPLTCFVYSILLLSSKLVKASKIWFPTKCGKYFIPAADPDYKKEQKWGWKNNWL